MGLAAERETQLAAVGKLPVFMRVGDGAIVPETGDFAIAPDGSPRVQVKVGPVMAAFLRGVADVFEGMG